MREIGAYEAKTHLPKLLEQVEKKGQRFVITATGWPWRSWCPSHSAAPRQSARRSKT
jgi:antitoxin (DNA-binding transcriptional repressor) of toxin-antitoxin stability system